MTQSDWRDFPALQQPNYPAPAELQAAVARLRALPPLVTSWEIGALKSQLAEAAQGKRLLLQGGDCAESFDECSSDAIAGKLKVLLQMSLVMVCTAPAVPWSEWDALLVNTPNQGPTWVTVSMSR